MTKKPGQGASGDVVPDVLSASRRLFAEKLTAARQAIKLTQAELSERSGVSQPHISQLEAGNLEPRLSTIISLSVALDVEPASLIPKPTSSFCPVGRGSLAMAYSFGDPVPTHDKKGHPLSADERLDLRRPMDREKSIEKAHEQIVRDAGATKPAPAPKPCKLSVKLWRGRRPGKKS